MKKILKPDCDNEQLYDDICSNKKIDKKNLLEQARADVLMRYKFYEANQNNLVAIQPNAHFSDKTKSALISCYKDSEKFKKIRPIILATVDTCPYCQIDRAKEIEHYFDKSTYPEYSVYVPNLIPCCSICNKTKGTKMFNSNNERRFIHFYFDTLPDYQFLFVEFDSNFSDISSCFQVFLKFNENDPMASIIRNHFNALDLINEYQIKLAEELDIFCGLINQNNKCDISSVVPHIKKQSNVYAERLGLNHFKTCFYQGLKNNETFLEILLNLQ